MKRSLLMAVALSLTFVTPAYAREPGPMGRRVREILAENSFRFEQQRFVEAAASKKPVPPMPGLIKEDEAVAVSESGDEFYIAKKDYVVTDKDAYVYSESSLNDFDYTPEQLEQIRAARNTASRLIKEFGETSPVLSEDKEKLQESQTLAEAVKPGITDEHPAVCEVSDYVVTDKDAYVYSESSLNDFDYTPEQLEQIRAARQQAKIDSQRIGVKAEEKLPVYTEVKATPMRAEGFATYRRKADALQIVRDAEPELKAKAEFTGSTVETAVATQQRIKDEYRTEKLGERHDGKTWDKIYNKEVSKDEFVPKTASMSKSLRNAIDESQRLRAELESLLGSQNVDAAIAAAKMSEYRGETFTPKENKALDNSSRVNYPDNTLYLNYQENKIYKIKIAADRETDIRLKEYEKVTDVTVGNQDDLYINGYRGENGVHPHITIKPYDSGIKTRMMVTTNYSRYQFELESAGTADYNPFVLFNLAGNPSAPVDFGSGRITGNATLKRTRKENRPIEVNDPDELNWNYFIKGKNLKPQYAWDDGRFTYILLPKKAYEHEIYILGMIDDRAQQIREFEIQDDFMKLYGTWSKIRMKINKEMIEIDNNGFIPE